MAYNAGFQYLEQRDNNDNIVHAGVVSKKQPFANADNTGIYDVIAEDLRVLYDDFNSSAMAKLKTDIQIMYDDMRNNPEFGSTAATAQAQKAIEAAKEAMTALERIESSAETVRSIEDYIPIVRDYVDTLATTMQEMKAIQAAVDSSKNIVNTQANKAESSAREAKTSEINAKASEDNAEAWAHSVNSPDNADDAESPTGKTQSSRTWAIHAMESMLVASDSETAAKDSEDKAKEYADNAKVSEDNARVSEDNAKTSETNASASEANALQSETNAKASEDNAKTSETNAATSESKAKTSETNAGTSESNALRSETNAKASEDNAASSEANAKKHEATAVTAAFEATSAAASAISSETNAKASEENAKVSEDKAKTSESNAKTYADSARQSAEAAAKAMQYIGSVQTVDDLPTDANVGDVYNVVEAGDGIKAGDNVVWNGESWDNFGGYVDMSAFYTKDDADALLADKSDVGHTHSQYLTAHQDISGKADKSSLSTVATSGSYTDLTNKPDLSKYLTSHQDISGKANTSGTYSGLSVGYASSAGSVAWSNVSGRPSSMPASDVYSWAKASSKPSYSWSEINDKPSSYTPASHTHSQYLTSHQDISGKLDKSGGTMTGNLNLKETQNIILRPSSEKWVSGIGHDTRGNECVALWAKNSVTSLRWYAGMDMSTMSSGKMMTITPDFEVSKADGAAKGYIGGEQIALQGSPNNFLDTENEFTFASSGFGGSIWFNYKTVGGRNGNIKEYIFGNGKGGSLGIAIHTGNIGDQSVNYANSAGSVAWSNVSGRPSSLPASDVYSWAKASSKPSYSWSEITNKPSIATSSGSITGNGYVKTADGLIFQSGSFTVSISSQDTEETKTITFPIPFTTVVGVCSVSNLSAGKFHLSDSTYFKSTLTGFSVAVDRDDNGTNRWFAIGY